MTAVKGERRLAASLEDVTVGQVAVSRPKTMSYAVTVAEARAAFADDHVHLLLLTDGPFLRGTLVRQDLPHSAAAPGPALEFSTLAGRTTRPEVPAEEARRRMIARGERRLAVVDRGGRLVGLLCLKRKLTGFCSDQDVQDRAGDR